MGAIAGAFAIEILLSPSPERPFGHTPMAHIVGWVGLILIGWTFAYPLKRRMHPNRTWPKGWFQIHQVCGIAGPMIIFIHAGGHFHALVPLLALVAMMLVVFTGITGQALHYFAFRLLYERRHEILETGLSEAEAEAHLHDLVLQEENLRWWRCVHGPLTWMFVVLVFLHIGGAIYFGGL